MTMIEDWAKLENPADFAVGGAPKKAAETKTKHPCDQCAGSGVWQSWSGRWRPFLGVQLSQ